MLPQWLPPAELRLRLPKLASLADLRTVDVDLGQQAEALPQELAHDRWLRQQFLSGQWNGVGDEVGEPGDLDLPPGAMAAIRQVAPLKDNGTGWLLEPTHFHLAKDHLVLVAGAAEGLEMEQAKLLAESIRPMLAEQSLAITVLTPARWLLRPLGPLLDVPSAGVPSALPMQLTCASAEAAGGRNVQGYLPVGPDALRYRKLLNEIQMTWHEHPVNNAREARSELPINSVWLSGPVSPRTLSLWNQSLAAGQCALDDSLLAPRLRDDQAGWLDALLALDARLHDLLTSGAPPSLLLCGDQGARWLQRKSRAESRGPSGMRGRIAGIARTVLSVFTRPATAARSIRGAPAGVRKMDALVQMFTES